MTEANRIWINYKPGDPVPVGLIYMQYSCDGKQRSSPVDSSLVDWSASGDDLLAVGAYAFAEQFKGPLKVGKRYMTAMHGPTDSMIQSEHRVDRFKAIVPAWPSSLKEAWFTENGQQTGGIEGLRILGELTDPVAVEQPASESQPQPKAETQATDEDHGFYDDPTPVKPPDDIQIAQASKPAIERINFWRPFELRDYKPKVHAKHWSEL